MPQEKPDWTILPLLETTARYFRDKGISSARVDAELLMAHLMGKKRIDLYLEHDRPLSRDEVSRFRDMVRARAGGKPVQRITGETEFYSVPLAVGEGVFIPRPETELLVDRGIEYFRALPKGEGRLACEVGAGTGAVSIALARNVPDLRVIAVDLSPQAVACARSNAERAGVEGRVEVREGDFAETLVSRAGEWDLIVSNPPYVTAEEMESLPTEVGDHDPRTALFGGSEGLDVYRRLVPAAAGALGEEGLLLLEVSDAVADGVLGLIAAQEALEEGTVARDYGGVRRVVSARMRKAPPEPPTAGEE